MLPTIFQVILLSPSTGAEGLPHGLGTRFFFWFFYIAMVTVFAAYSAMLVSFLAVQTMVLPFEDVEGMLEEGTYKLGILRGTSQLDYFRVSLQLYGPAVLCIKSNVFKMFIAVITDRC